MEAGEVGVLIRVDSEIDLTGAPTIVLRVKGPLDAVFRSLSMTQGVPNNIAERTTIATDFPDAGNYFVQLTAFNLLSPMQLINVGEVVSAVTCS